MQPRPAVPALLCSCVGEVAAARVAWGCEGPGEVGEGTKAGSYLGNPPAPGKAVEAMPLDVGAEGLGLSPASPVKPWASVFTSLGFGFLICRRAPHGLILALPSLEA